MENNPNNEHVNPVVINGYEPNPTTKWPSMLKPLTIFALIFGFLVFMQYLIESKRPIFYGQIEVLYKDSHQNETKQIEAIFVNDTFHHTYVYDFDLNLTGIGFNNHCFLLPLQRVLPSKSYVKYIRKFSIGYKSFDVRTQHAKIKMPPVEDPRLIGPNIMQKCYGKDVFMVEKIKSVYSMQNLFDEADNIYQLGGEYVECIKMQQ
ncbi:unnamed protein product [Brassicogethes aeneus]|uniref:Integral membrane protein 2 n=1 Tax=Brassicogethes aeneus TaxID=1431903 RepID=A0A9P0ASU6_BRAAE|nr:unnamed protein product [Brassicogethes aeneus]